MSLKYACRMSSVSAVDTIRRKRTTVVPPIELNTKSPVEGIDTDVVMSSASWHVSMSCDTHNEIAILGPRVERRQFNDRVSAAAAHDLTATCVHPIGTETAGAAAGRSLVIH